jgi:subfamily B ATP-binding cassette protein MsbA
MGLVTQDSILFNDTIKANIALGKLDASDDEIIAALKIIMLMNCRKRFTKRYHT